MHPLHEYVAKQLAEKLKTRKIVVWYDPRREFTAFIDELLGAPRTEGCLAVPVSPADVSAHIAVYAGSFFELRAVVEPHVSGDEADPVVLYVPDCERDRRASILMELEKAGECYEPPLKRLARNVLRRRYTDGVIDEMLAPEGVTYEDLARAISNPTDAPSILKSIFHDAPGHDGLIAAWLASDTRDGAIEAKQATRELVKLIRSRLGAEVPEDASLPKLRAITLRYVLAGEFRSDLRGPPPPGVGAVPSPKTKEDEGAVRELAKRLRTNFATAYPDMADQVEKELELSTATIPAEGLGSIDTFRFEERLLLAHCGELIAAHKFAEALALVAEREHSFWLDRDVIRKAQWEASRRMAELGAATMAIRAAMAKMGNGPQGWIDAYTSKDGWYRMDQAQRRLEAWVANEVDPDERALGVVRRAYEDACHAMAAGFTSALAKAKWTAPGALHQTRVYNEVVAGRPRPVAYFLVDAMRFEMGMELAERLPKNAEVSVRAAVGSLPSITVVGMAALQPGASASFAIVEQGGTLGARIDDAFLPDSAARKKFASARVPKLVHLGLDELLGLPPSKLVKRLEDAQVVFVKSQEIDHAGEAGFSFQARQVMDTVIDNLARAVRKLSVAGVEHSVISADHGHLFFPADREESMRIDSPGGEPVELHRRCWIGRGGSTPPGCVRVTASELGYVSDLEFVFPVGCGVFKAGGDLAFHHGGPSLQELIVPVLTVRLKAKESGRPVAGPITAAGIPDAVTNRIFSVTIQLERNLSLFSGSMTVRPLLMAAGKQVGAVGMAIEADLDRATGCVTLVPGKPTMIAFLLSDERAAAVRVVVQDPATDADLYRSPADIPVRLGV